MCWAEQDQTAWCHATPQVGRQTGGSVLSEQPVNGSYSPKNSAKSNWQCESSAGEDIDHSLTAEIKV